MRGLLLVPEGPPLDLLLPRLGGGAGVRLEGWAPRWVQRAARACPPSADPSEAWVLRCGRWYAPPAWGGDEPVAGAVEVLMPPANPLARALRSVWPADRWPCERAFAITSGMDLAVPARQLRPADRPKVLLTLAGRARGVPPLGPAQ